VTNKKEKGTKRKRGEVRIKKENEVRSQKGTKRKRRDVRKEQREREER